MARSHRAELTKLRTLLAKQSVDEIATEVQARYGYSRRAAYRHAVGWTLDEAAERYNHVADDAQARLSGPQLSAVGRRLDGVGPPGRAMDCSGQLATPAPHD